MAKKGPQVAKRKRPKTGGSLLGVSELLGVPADGDGDHPPPKKKVGSGVLSPDSDDER